MFAFREKWNMGTGGRGVMCLQRGRGYVCLCACVWAQWLSWNQSADSCVVKTVCVCLSVQWKPPASLFLFGRFNKPSIKTEFYFNYCLISLASTHSTVTQRIFWRDLPRMLLIRSCLVILFITHLETKSTWTQHTEAKNKYFKFQKPRGRVSNDETVYLNYSWSLLRPAWCVLNCTHRFICESQTSPEDCRRHKRCWNDLHAAEKKKKRILRHLFL